MNERQPARELMERIAGWNTAKFVETATPVTIRRFLEAGADLDARDSEGLTPLHQAAKSSSDGANVEALLLAAGRAHGVKAVIGRENLLPAAGSRGACDRVMGKPWAVRRYPPNRPAIAGATWGDRTICSGMWPYSRRPAQSRVGPLRLP